MYMHTNKYIYIFPYANTFYMHKYSLNFPTYIYNDKNTITDTDMIIYLTNTFTITYAQTSHLTITNTYVYTHLYVNVCTNITAYTHK